MAKSKKVLAKENLLLLSAVTLLIISSSLFTVLQPNEQLTSIEQTRVGTSTPVLSSEAETLKLSARAVYALDLSSGDALFSKNAGEPLLPASTTKIATALVALTHYGLDDILVVDEESVKVDGQKMELTEGEGISVNNLIYGLLVFSANDAAEVLARNYPGGRDNFILAMNRLADNVGLEKTHFTNPVGFDEYLHFSTTRDLVHLASYAVNNPIFAEIVATRRLNVASADGATRHELVNINKLLGKVPGVLGVKTGWTVNAQEALVTLVERDGQKVMIAVLGSEDRFGDTEKLIDWIFTSYSWEP